MDPILATALVVVGCAISFIGGYYYERSKSATNVALLTADLNGQKMARKAQQDKYDQLYDSFLRVNQYNKKLQMELDGNASFQERKGDEVRSLYQHGMSRRDICAFYPSISYSTICLIIKNKQASEKANLTADPKHAKQKGLL